ncbi:hypothetical protein [Saccharothrix hoggarensis]|uniref:Uncharacterized protein n=1 Tax=Saccharothrix hoggarensis TaxID=913853 RepID=A0ABW3QSY0_9PSEU
MAGGRGGLSAVSVVLLAPALALLGNLATNTVEVSWRWWSLTVWAVVALLVVATVWVEVSRARSRAVDADDDPLDDDPADGEPVIVTSQFLDVDYSRDDVTGSLIPVSGHVLRLVVESRSRRRVVLRSLRPEVVRREPARGRLLPHAGSIRTRAFRLDLSDGAPVLKAFTRQDDFPLWVSRDEPEVIDVRVVNTDGVVSWRLFLDWTVDGRSGSVAVDAGGRPFQTARRP